MSVAIVFLIVAFVAFGLAFLSKRRFGVLGLALVAGSLLSEMWAAEVTEIVEIFAYNIQNPPLLSLVSIGILLLPAIILLFSGPSYFTKSARIVGSLLFAILAMTLLIVPLGSVLVLTGSGKELYDTAASLRSVLLTFGLIAALVDVLLTHVAKVPKDKKH